MDNEQPKETEQQPPLDPEAARISDILDFMDIHGNDRKNQFMVLVAMWAIYRLDRDCEIGALTPQGTYETLNVKEIMDRLE